MSLVFLLSRQPETRGGLYIWGTPDYGLFIQSRGQMLWKIGQFAYHPEWRLFDFLAGIGTAPRENTLPTPWGWTRLRETAIRISGDAGKSV